MSRSIALVIVLGGVGCTGSASARFELANTSLETAPRHGVLADGTSLRLKMLATYLAEDVDPVTQNNVGVTSMIWLNPECAGDISGCNVEGMALPPGPRVTSYFDLARPTEEINAELDSQDAVVEPATYRYARVELCKSYGGQTQAEVPTLMWRGPGMVAEEPFTSADCARTSLAFDPPLVVEAGDAVTVRLGYELSRAIATGAPATTSPHCGFALEGVVDADGSPHCFRTCADTEAGRTCVDFPDFAPTAVRF